MKRFIIVLIIFSSSIAYCQLSAGLRAGPKYGLVARDVYVLGDDALEMIISIDAVFGDPGEKMMTILYEAYNTTYKVDGLSWYLGGGGHVGRNSDKDQSYLGIDVIAGIEYDLGTIIGFPLSISLDYKPALHFIPLGEFDLIDIALSIRFSF